jgi:predicted CoA-binding protein
VKTIAVAGCSPEPYPDSHSGARYPACPDLLSAREGKFIDTVDFSRSSELGIAVIMDKCLRIEHEALQLQGKL